MTNRLRSFTMRTFGMALCVTALLLGSGCELRKKMYDQPRYKTYAESDFFADGSSARPLVEGTVPRGSCARTITSIAAG